MTEDTKSRAQPNLNLSVSTVRGHKRRILSGDRSSYEPLASEYHAPWHITSRNFEAATRAWFLKHSVQIPEGYVLDLGAGRGATQAYCAVPSRRIIQADLSFSMLTLNPREPSHARVNCDALALPFADRSFAGVTAFLFDPFNRPPLEFETFRVLRSGGLFVGTLPHYLWGRTLRSLRLINLDKTRFLLASGVYIERDSYLTDEAHLRRRFASAGYDSVTVASLALPRGVNTVSPDIQDPAESLGIDAYELTIVSLVIASKP